MTRLACTALALIFLCAPGARADVAVHATVATGAGAVVSGTNFIKGRRMRSDLRRGETVQSTIYDLDSQILYRIDTRRHEVDAWDMRTLTARLGEQNATDLQASLVANGDTREIDGQLARRYDLHVSMSVALAGPGELRLQVALGGPVWINPDTPAAAEQNAFLAAAAEGGWIFSDPDAALAQPGSARAIAEMYRQLAAAGGIVYESDLQLQMISAAAPGEAAKLGAISMLTRVVSVTAEPLADELFAPPPGYTVRKRN